MGKAADRRRRQKAERIRAHGEGAHQEALQRRAYKAELLERIKIPRRQISLAKSVIDPLWTEDSLTNTRNDEAWETEAARKIEARMVDPKNPKPTDKIATRPINVYYVIAGRGPAAICNHTTLRQSEEGRKRLGDLPVLHVGFPDPWKSYFAHGMGQPPYLLGLPGFEASLEEAELHRGRCHSEQFAAATEHEWNRLVGSFPDTIRLVEGAVLWVQRGCASLPSDPAPFADLATAYPDVVKDLKAVLAEPYPSGVTAERAPYRVAVVLPDGKVGLVYAKYVDFCTGAGRPTLLTPRAPIVTPIIDGVEGLRAPPWISPAKFWETAPRHNIMSGNDALLREIAWPKDERVASFGAGGVGLNMVERAEDEGVALDWISDKSILGNGMLLTGNVPVLRDRRSGQQLQASDALAVEVAAAAKPDTAVNEKERVETIVGPWGETVRFIRKAPLAKARVSADGTQIGLEFTPRTNARCVDAFEAQGVGPALNEATGGTVTPRHFAPYSQRYGAGAGAPFNVEYYNRLIWTIGQEGASSGNPKSAAGHLGLSALNDGTFIVGLADKTGAIRVLGACAQAYPESPMKVPVAQGKVAETPTQKFFESLPVSAVPPGFIFSGVCIAMANKVFTGTSPNPNVNTMPKAELEKILIAAGAVDAPELARRVLIERRKDNGFATLEAFWTVVVAQARVLPADAGLVTIEERQDDERFAEILFAGYRPSTAKLEEL